MRWERLFADLEARFEAEERAIAEGDVIDLVRAERGRLTLHDRLRAHVGESLTWSLAPGEVLERGDLIDLGADWVLVRTVHEEVLIPIDAVQYISGLSRAADPSAGEVARRLGLAAVLRGLSRNRAVVDVRLRNDQRLTGTIDRVGVDHLDLAVHDREEPRRGPAVHGVRCVPFSAVAGVGVR